MADKQTLNAQIDDLAEELGGRKNGDRRIPLARDAKLLALLRQIVAALPD